MAARKVRKRYGAKKNPTRETLNQPDEVKESLSGLWEWIHRYRYILTGVIVGLFVLSAGVTFYTRHQRAARREASKALLEALDLYRAPVGEPPAGLPPNPDEKRFDTEQAKYEAIVDAFDRFAKEHGGSELVALATVAKVPALAALGRYDDARAALDTWTKEHGDDDPLSGVTTWARAALADAKGNAKDAAAGFATWEKSADWFKGAWGGLSAGDAALRAGDAAAAKQHYDAALAGLGAEDAPHAKLTPAKFLRSEIERRQRFLSQ